MTKHVTLKEWQLNSIMKRDEKVITHKTFFKIFDELTAADPDWLFDFVYDIEEEEFVVEHAYVDVMVNNVQMARLYSSHYTRSRGKKCDRHEYKLHKL